MGGGEAQAHFTRVPVAERCFNQSQKSGVAGLTSSEITNPPVPVDDRASLAERMRF
jgi:hypothetical protein